MMIIFSINWILVKIDRCLCHELARILITEDIHVSNIMVCFCILLKCCKSRNGTVGKVGNKQNDKKTDFKYQRTGEH